jgi:hypothetical protein
MEPDRFVNCTAHVRDRELAAALKGARAMPVSGKPVLVAFRNEAGEMYRFALLYGPAQLRYLRRRLVQLRLLQDLEDDDGMMTVLGGT